MKNFFLILNAEEIGKLRQNAVSFVDFEVDGNRGIVVEEAIMPLLLGVLGKRVVREGTTVYEGIFWLELASVAATATPEPPTPAPAPQFTVRVANWNGNQQDSFVGVARELLTFINKNVTFHVPHGEASLIYEDGGFHILIWTSPVGGQSRHVPEKIWGQNVDCRDNSFAPSGKGIVFRDDATGYEVAELVGGDNLFIHHDLCHKGTGAELEIFKKLISLLILELSATPEQKEQRARELAERKRQIARERYIAECSKRFEKSLSDTRRGISEGKVWITQTQKDLVKRIREVVGKEAKLEQMEVRRGDHEKRYALEFEKLQQVPKILDVDVQDGVIRVFTDTLYCTDPRSGKVHEIGRFRIDISTNGASDGVRWFNLTRQVNAFKQGMQAPHVFPEGHACLGSLQEALPELIAGYEFSVVAMLAIQFVESVNTADSAGAKINLWPVFVPGPMPQ